MKTFQIAPVVTLTLVGVIASAAGNYAASVSAFWVAALFIYNTWLEGELDKAVKLAWECLEGWKRSHESLKEALRLCDSPKAENTHSESKGVAP